MSVHPSPHVGVTHAPPTQIPFAPQTPHVATAVAGWHFCPFVEFGPVSAWHVVGLVPHRLSFGHVSLGVVWQENWQSGSHPEPVTLFPEPKSHCSPGSITPFPHSAVWQLPPWQVPAAPASPTPHGVPPGGAVPVTHLYPVSPFTTTLVQAFVPAQRSTVVHEPDVPGAHEYWQLSSHPVPAPFPAPKSHCSPGSTTPSPQ